MRWNVRFFSSKIRERIEGYGNLPDWKQTALKDFKFWLEDLPDAAPPGQQSMTAESCDLYTMLSEFSALRQEIRIQTREQSKTLETLTSFISAYDETKDIFKDRSQALAELEDRIRQASEKRAVLPFLDVRDTLSRGYHSSRALADACKEMAKAKSGFFRSAPKGTEEIAQGIEGIVEGYEMAIRRFDRALELADIRIVKTVGHPFDAKTMKAVGKRSEPDTEEGIVVEEHLSGFVRGEEVIRTAEVIVSG
jgi:molecular chaperone GrpE (heat shock protein)